MPYESDLTEINPPWFSCQHYVNLPSLSLRITENFQMWNTLLLPVHQLYSRPLQLHTAWTMQHNRSSASKLKYSWDVGLCRTINMTCLSFSTPLGCTDGNVTTSRWLFQEPENKARREEILHVQAQGSGRRVNRDRCVGIFNGCLLLSVLADLQTWITLNPEEKSIPYLKPNTDN